MSRRAAKLARASLEEIKMIRARSGYIKQTPTGHIAISDVSGGDFVGYDYAVTVSFWDGASPRQIILLSHTHWGAEVANHLGTMGAFYAVFEENEYAAAIAKGERLLADYPMPPHGVPFVPGVGPFILAGTFKDVS
jgi:hypothetical protein